ncbi:hypothetical protein QQS21_003796 [Conoideocrella luteorostrata]|uniref:Protein bir1 n=1 Tax=Conoideocrella luteorostrata TaxID=1105319 RepID=A0AAJ0CSP7_9HYPO|nr:hypothetical protein QQS21_003796 [Conoideocrella luteorostrata]
MDQYFTYEARLASFQKNSKKRGSTAGGRGKALNWPHKQIAPASLAKAGFYFEPYPENPDNCVCFLCAKGLDGWETGDDPLEEHLKHANNCGWAIATAIEVDIEKYATQDPSSPDMVEARKATFAGKWPHDGRKGWKCKTKQLVEAGWSYTPTEESDDMATCADEHFNRSPNCSFFTLLDQFGGAKKKTTRGKAVRGSKASRLSVQSVATAASDIGSVADMTAEPEDSVLTTASTMTQEGKKTAGRKKKATATKASRAKSKKSQAVEQEELEDQSGHKEVVPQPKATKSTRGKKRTSDAIDDSIVFLSEAPAPKRKATLTRESSQVDSSTITPEDIDLVEASRATSRASSSSTKSNRKPSALSASMASLRAAPEDFPDDEEIERQLEADLERFATDDEIAHDSESERSIAKTKNNMPKTKDYAMFDPVEVEADDGVIDEELRNLQAEMEVDGPKQELHVPKKGRKAATGTRKASTQTKQKKAKAPSPSPEPETEAEIIEPLVVEEEEEEEHEASIGSTDTVVKKSESVQSPSAKRTGGRVAKSSLASNASSKSANTSTKPVRGRPAKKATTTTRPADSPTRSAEQPDNDGLEIHEDTDEGEAAATLELKQSSPPPEISSPVISRSRLVAEPPSTPAKIVSPAPSARQPALSPSQSPQSSDAENQPPSSIPAPSAKTKRVVLAPVAVTPMCTSPSKRNMLAAGLQSQTPWTAIDLDAVMGTPRVMVDKENAVSRLFQQGKELTSPEKRMTVEEWIYFNAGEAENKLKHECEAMVTQFEKEGTRAMNVLEGLPQE